MVAPNGIGPNGLSEPQHPHPTAEECRDSVVVDPGAKHAHIANTEAIEPVRGSFRVRLPEWTPANKSWSLDLLAVPGITLHRLTAPAQPDLILDSKWRYHPKSCLQWESTDAAPPAAVDAILSYQATGLWHRLVAMDWTAWIGPGLGAFAVIAAAVMAQVYSDAAAAMSEIRGRAQGVCAEPLGREVVNATDVQDCLLRYAAHYKELRSFQVRAITQDQRKQDLNEIREIVQ